MKYNCECIDCGHTLESDRHCSEMTCPDCGGRMRRKERPGPGRGFSHNSNLSSPEPRWNSIIIDRLPGDAFADSAGRGYAHHYIQRGSVGAEGVYDSGVMRLHKGGLIEAWKRAESEGAGEEVIAHIEGHLREAGIEIKNNDRKNIYLGKTGEMEMKGLPRIDEIDLNRVVAKIDLARARSGDDLETREIDKINLLTRSDVKKSDIYAFPVWASNDQPDSYFTRMDPATTLPNYVADFIDGRGLMLSHAESMIGATPAGAMPIGSSFDAAIKSRADRAGQWVEAWLYILRDVSVGDINTSDAIRMIEAGIWKRVSIGFSIQPMEGRPKGRYICEICNNDLLSGDCDHLPGFEYDGKLCIARVVGGGLREVSLVYMNAAQGTVVQKARMLAEAGKIKDKDILALEMSYGVRFFNKKNSVVVPKIEGRNPEKTEERKMEEMRAIMLGLTGMLSKVGRSAVTPLITRAEKATDEAGLAAVGTELAEEVRSFINEAQGHRELVEAIPEDSRSVEGVKAILASAEDGKTHRSAILEEALAEGVRFEGDDFDTDHWKRVLESMPIDGLSKQRDLWRKQADGKLKAGQRSTETPPSGVVVPEKGEGKEREIPSAGVPDEAYACGKSFI